MIGASLATRVPRTGLCMQYGCCRAGTARPAHGNSVSYVIVSTFDRLDCAANAKINLKIFSVYSRGFHALT